MPRPDGQLRRDLPLTVMGQSALVRLGVALVALLLLWAAVAWAVALP